MTTELEYGWIKVITIKEYDNFMIFNFSLSGTPYYLIGVDNEVLIFTHSDEHGNIQNKETIRKYINQFPGQEIEIICCYPNKAKEDYEFGKYIKINSNKKIYAKYSTSADNYQLVSILCKTED